MTDGVKLSGRCMCGAVRFTGTAKEPKVAVCHCIMCRRWSSGPYFEVVFTEATFEGEDNISTIRSSDWAERSFCSKCGSNLYYRMLDSDELQVAAGLLDDQSGLRLTRQFFIDRQPPYYTLADETENMTSSEIYAAFAAQTAQQKEPPTGK